MPRKVSRDRGNAGGDALWLCSETRSSVLQRLLVEFEPIELWVGLRSLQPKARKLDNVDRYFAVRAQTYASLAKTLHRLVRKLDRLIATDEERGKRDEKSQVARMSFARTAAVFEDCVEVHRGPKPFPPNHFRLFVELGARIRRAGFTDRDLADLILASNTDWRDPPCNEFRSQYSRDLRTDGPGGARKRLQGRLREMRSTFLKITKELRDG